MNIKQLVQDGAPIVDVRSKLEFFMGKVSGSINIPLHEVPDRIQDFKALKQPVLLCCASGNRSGQAADYLTSKGIKCYNAGSWQTVKQVLR